MHQHARTVSARSAQTCAGSPQNGMAACEFATIHPFLMVTVAWPLTYRADIVRTEGAKEADALPYPLKTHRQY